MFTLDQAEVFTKDALLEQIESRIQTKKVAIIGGHYLLMYQKGKLVPLIKGELKDTKSIKLAEDFAGNFPIQTFEYSLELYQRLNLKGVESKIILLVNDHKFQSSNFQSEIKEEIHGKAGILRKSYYSANTIPVSFNKSIDDAGLLIKDVIFQNNNQDRKKDDLLPKESYFYSEQKLRNRFDKFVKPNLLEKGTIYQQSCDTSVDLFYDMPAMGDEIPLTEEGTCGCSAEVMELIGNLQRKGFEEVIFFVPNECATPVDNGIMAALNINKVPSGIVTITGFGGVDQITDMNEEYKIIEQRMHQTDR